MSGRPGQSSQRALVLAPMGRDAAIAAAILADAGVQCESCADLAQLTAELARGAGLALVVEEALAGEDYAELARWIDAQPAWSDMPIVLLTGRGAGLERNPTARRFIQSLGNVSFLERPFHPTTLVSLVEAALRGRRRQYEARERMEEIRQAEEMLERRVRDRTSELESANRQLASQIAERERIESVLHHAQRLEAVGQLTSGVAHDFNNLLMVILGNVRLIRKANPDEETARRLMTISQAAERGAALTAQMLAFSRSQKLDARPVDLNETVRRMHHLLQGVMGGSVEIHTRLQDDLWPALIDPTQIELVILNLAINARDAMAVGGKLTVSTANVTLGPPERPEDAPAGDHVMIQVSDTGEGMSAEVLSKAFEPFFTTKQVGKGSGLGLSQVFGVAKQSGGGVRIDSSPGNGSSVQVYLPRSTAPARRASADDRAEAQQFAVPEREVLLVDDDSAVREITAAFLADLGYRVVEAGSGGAALELLDRDDTIELVLLDFAMPGMNGAEVAREARARRPNLPIVFLSGYADTAALGEQRVLRKPFQLEELAATVRLALSG